MTAWIDERGARSGCRVQLLPHHEVWEVVEAFGHTMPEDALREHQRLHRGSLPSVERMS
ncbi:hypothetical protein CCUG20998_03556 [Mycobacterium marinum]|nr:hypothetical protein CCUG20998_03556 [Mycobacterium marinum]RFZ28331.1 hypothetical protein DSM44344_01376 [Mycobacterium marinum]